MRTSKFTNEQIVQALRQAESGTPVVDICRKLGVSEQTFYRWKRKFTGLDVSNVHELKQLRDENRKLKKPGRRAEPRQDDPARGAPTKMVSPAQRRELVGWAKDCFQLTERRACRALAVHRAVHRAMIRYQSTRPPQEPLRARLHELARDRISFAYLRLHVMLRREGWIVSHKRVYRLYRQEGLSLTRKRPRPRADGWTLCRRIYRGSANAIT